jgi:hypothetical protein
MIDIFDFSFPFVLPRFVLETLLWILSSFSLPHLGGVGHIEVMCVHVLVLCHRGCVSLSFAYVSGWWKVYVPPVWVLDTWVLKIAGESFDESCVHLFYDVFLAQSYDGEYLGHNGGDT